MKTKQELEDKVRELEELEATAKAEYKDALKLTKKATRTARAALAQQTRYNIQLMRVRGAIEMAEDEEPS